MNRFIVLFLAFIINSFAYKDSLYFGGYTLAPQGKGKVHGSYLDDTLSYSKKEFEISGKGYGIRFGYDNNQNKEHSTKERLEMAFEKRVFNYTLNNKEYDVEGHRFSIAAAYGKKIDIFLTNELTLLGKVAFGYAKAKKIDKGTDLSLGLNLVYATRDYEFLLGVDREFRVWGSHKIIPYNYFEPKIYHEITNTFYGGINIRF